jgi:hypothetical protein
MVLLFLTFQQVTLKFCKFITGRMTGFSFVSEKIAGKDRTTPGKKLLALRTQYYDQLYSDQTRSS